jgi:hypothetical protein
MTRCVNRFLLPIALLFLGFILLGSLVGLAIGLVVGAVLLSIFIGFFVGLALAIIATAIVVIIINRTCYYIDRDDCERVRLV